VRVAGQRTDSPDALWDIRRRVGVVWQDPDNQLVGSTVEDDVAFGPENLGLPSDEITRRVEAALSVVGLEDLRQFPPHRLSGGQKQLLAIAGVLAMGPEAVILDEATSMLDPGGRRQVLAVARSLAAEHGVTVVLVTHHMDEAGAAGRVIALERGRVAFDGAPDRLFADADICRRCGLEPSPLVRIARGLRSAGIDVPAAPRGLAELVEHLCRSW